RHGWVGIQRYDDISHYGIDLIRNGRAIRLLEQMAFFEFVDEMGNTMKDYPIDSQYGRIVGEVHLDHIPVDFMKQDFQRSSAEWQRAMIFLRGESSLQPTQPGAEDNKSYIFKLFQGYRRVRKCGQQDLYMGYWDNNSNSPKRISREIEREYLQKFNEKEPGYYDDSEWWKLVENATTRPQDTLVECTSCGADNLETAEECLVCHAVLIGKECKYCGQKITSSSIMCHFCGKSQISEISRSWICQVCGLDNLATAETCRFCSSPIGTTDPLTQEHLRANSYKVDDLSVAGCSIKLADGNHSTPIDIVCYYTRRPIMAKNQKDKLPLTTSIEESIEIFIDSQHAILKSYSIVPEILIASEVAHYLHTYNGSVSGHSNHKAHTVSNLMAQIISKYYSDSMESSPEKLRESIQAMFSEIKQKMTYTFTDIVAEIFDNLSDIEKKMMLDDMIANQIDVALMKKYKDTGQFLLYIAPISVVNVFKAYPYRFFDKAIWSIPYSTVPDIPESALDQMRESLKSTYQNCLEDCASYITVNLTNPLLTKRTVISLNILLKDIN
ncbi:MAG: zinc ribbon domain-containing protein, partial [Candidatus Cloacimonetes bacterium]|nr:zinc ribbon domain-containing protein [Candidatus Cloacimonadota bacterium]MDY0230065.1 zinc ribbon domain-containing protein [Candidatus Cloacimonadaceae bacterium]